MKHIICGWHRLAAYSLTIFVMAFATSHAVAINHFSIESNLDKQFSYRLYATGTTEHSVHRDIQSTSSFSLDAHVVITTRSGQPGVAPSVSVSMIPERVQRLSGADQDELFHTQGQLTSAGTLQLHASPTFLNETGFELADFLIGWAVPAPSASPPGQDWIYPFPSTAFVNESAVEYDITTNFIGEGTQFFRGNHLEKVSARFRATPTRRPATSRLTVQHIGAGNYYLHPDTGLTDISSISFVKTVELPGLTLRDTRRTKYSVTVTLELIDVAKADPLPVEPAEPIVEPGEPIVPTGPIEDETDLIETDPIDPIQPLEPAEPEEVRDPTQSEETAEVVEPEELVDSIDAEPIEQVEQVEPADPVESTFVYKDPAERFTLELPERFQDTPVRISSTATQIEGTRPGELINVYVRPLPSPGADALAIQEAVIQSYAATLPNFILLGKAEPDQLDGVAAYRVNYHYVDEQGKSVIEWALFARKDNSSYQLEYTPGEGYSHLGRPTLIQLQEGFSFGTDTRGMVTAESLLETMRPYDDPDGRFHMLIPAYWPFTDRTDDGASTIFTEIGDRGYVSVYVESGATGIPTEMILNAWMQQSQNEAGFQSVVPLHPVDFAGGSGSTFTYSWTGSADVQWTGRVQAIVIDDELYAVIIGYESDGFDERLPVFERMLESFVPGSQLVDAEDSTETPPAPVSPEPGSTLPLRETDVAEIDTAAFQPFSEPDDDDTVLMIGRVLTRYQGQNGQMVDAWGTNLEVAILADREEYVGLTDEKGYVYVTGLPALGAGREYSVLHFEGEMFGFTEPVQVSFSDLRVGLHAPRVSDLRTIVITLNSDRTLTVDIVRGDTLGPDGITTPEYFVRHYPNSQWSDYVRVLIDE